MNDGLICPNCHIGLATGDLVTQTWRVQSCPYCRAMVRKDEQLQWEDQRQRNQEDRAAIEAWILGAQCAGALYVVKPVVDWQDGSGADCRWSVEKAAPAGVRPGWVATIEYRERTPGLFSVELTAEHHGAPATSEQHQRLLNTFAARGIQAVAGQVQSWKAWEGQRTWLRWGGRFLLQTSPLPASLFAGVLGRLEAALDEAGKQLGWR